MSRLSVLKSRSSLNEWPETPKVANAGMTILGVVGPFRAGGKVMNEKTALPGMGAWAMFIDPDGISIGVYEDKKQ